jgi:flavin reductase (DIM6/NTAB) family NADH-FMN oxidoreductase RutF
VSDRIELAVADVEGGIYPWLTASLIPRAIAWVSTQSADGVDNVAPHSFTTVAGVDPPTLCFTSVGHKDTLANVRATGEFVLNIGSSDLLHAMNDSATNFPGSVSEFDAARLEREPSAVVAPPRVRAAPIAFECRVSGEHEIGRASWCSAPSCTSRRGAMFSPRTGCPTRALSTPWRGWAAPSGRGSVR